MLRANNFYGRLALRIEQKHLYVVAPTRLCGLKTFYTTSVVTSHSLLCHWGRALCCDRARGGRRRGGRAGNCTALSLPDFSRITRATDASPAREASQGVHTVPSREERQVGYFPPWSAQPGQQSTESTVTQCWGGLDRGGGAALLPSGKMLLSNRFLAIVRQLNNTKKLSCNTIRLCNVPQVLLWCQLFCFESIRKTF